MRTTWKEMVAFLLDWRDYLNGISPANYAELDWSDGDSPIYDQLEREWAKKGYITVQ